MKTSSYTRLRVVIFLFVMLLAWVGALRENYGLCALGGITGMVFLVLVRSRVRRMTDERTVAVSEKAAKITYAVFTPTVGIGAILLLLPYERISPVFAKGEFTYLSSLGIVLAYLTLFLVIVYAVSYFVLNLQYGGGEHEK